MLRLSVTLSWIALLLSAFCHHARAAPPGMATLDIGASAPDFELSGVDDKTCRLADFADAKVRVVIFTCNHCPTAQAYEDRLIQLHADYQDRGVALVAISPNDPQSVRLDELGYTDVNDPLELRKAVVERLGRTYASR